MERWKWTCFQVIQGEEFIVLDVGRAHNLWKNESVERLGLSKRAAGWCLAKTQSSVIPCAGTNTIDYLPSKDTKLGRL